MLAVRDVFVSVSSTVFEAIGAKGGIVARAVESEAICEIDERLSAAWACESEDVLHDMMAVVGTAALNQRLLVACQHRLDLG